MAHEADREGYIACELHNEAQYRLCSGVVARLRATTRAGGHRPNPFGLPPFGAGAGGRRGNGIAYRCENRCIVEYRYVQCAYSPICP